MLSSLRSTQHKCCGASLLFRGRYLQQSRDSNNSAISSYRRLMSSGGNNANKSTTTTTPGATMTKAEREKAIHEANKSMEGYAQTRILAKKGLLKSKRSGPSEQSRKQHQIQFVLFLSLAGAFIASPILGRKIAQDHEFREKWVPAWYDFRIKSPESAWTRQELHEQIVAVEKDIRERAIRGEFTPEKIAEMKNSLQPRSDLSEEDLYYAKKYGWGAIHPGVDPDDDDEDDD